MLLDTLTVAAEEISTGGGSVSPIWSVLVACIMIIPGTVAAIVSLKNRKTAQSADRKIDRLASDVETNHGERPGFYLEMVQEVKEIVDDVRAELRVFRHEINETVETQGAEINERIDRHTQQDDERFGEIKLMIRGVDGEVSDLEGEVHDIAEVVTKP